MLSRMRYLGRRAIANAVYEVDFAAIRDRSISSGSLYLFKSLPDEITSGRTSRSHVCDYTGHIFGEIDAVFESGDGVYIRARCPAHASCAVKKLFKQQIDLLRSILIVDNAKVDSSINSSWFDSSKLKESMRPVDDCFYLAVKGTGRSAGDWNIGECRMFTVNLFRYNSEALHSRDYWLNVEAFAAYSTSYFPRANHAGYICDVQYVSGASTAQLIRSCLLPLSRHCRLCPGKELHILQCNQGGSRGIDKTAVVEDHSDCESNTSVDSMPALESDEEALQQDLEPPHTFSYADLIARRQPRELLEWRVRDPYVNDWVAHVDQTSLIRPSTTSDSPDSTNAPLVPRAIPRQLEDSDVSDTVANALPITGHFDGRAEDSDVSISNPITNASPIAEHFVRRAEVMDNIPAPSYELNTVRLMAISLNQIVPLHPRL
ncbi:hypothetical protein C8R43DRAFT_949315 [Mycena crocata]|nr:hypothetical protein C8R43DRAFT_949315 [Mycena crocata]